jgi:hypothetical protein
VIIILTFPEQQLMAPESLQPSVTGAELSRTTGTSTDTPHGETQQQLTPQYVHCEETIVATGNMLQDGIFKTIPKSKSSKSIN